MHKCQLCSAEYEIIEMEKNLRLKVAPFMNGKVYDFPDSPFCPQCRQQRRMSFRNDLHLFKRKCSKTGKTILSTFRDTVPFPVYASDEWWSDRWDPKDYGQDYDFNRPFFDQLEELSKKVPRLNATVLQSENCEYTTFTLRSKNVYLSSRVEGDDVLYSYLIIHGSSIMDSYGLGSCELNYECIDNLNCYNCIYTEMSKNCSDLKFCLDMLGSKNCFGCVGLVQKEFHFFNEALSKEDYEKKVAEWWDGSYEAIERSLTRLRELKNTLPQRNLITLGCENVFGSYIFHSTNVWHSFDIVSSQDLIYTTQADFSKDICHSDFTYKSEMCYEQISASDSQKMAFNFGGYVSCDNLYYTIECVNRSSNLFACVAMKGAKYCILNKQYTKEEYEAMIPKIIEHMKSTGEWGIFFPPKLSPYPYNDSVAQMRYPLSKELALSAGWQWADTVELPAPEQATEGVNICPVSGRPFRHLKAELELGSKFGVPPAKLHPDIRHENRVSRRRNYRLRGVECSHCRKNIWTDLGEAKKIYCEECFMKVMY